MTVEELRRRYAAVMGEPSRSRHKTHLIAWRIAGGTSAPASLVTQGLGTTRAFHYTVYTVTVAGMLGPGTVTASLAAGVAHDAAGNGNFASAAATVTYDHTPLFADADVEDAVHDALQLPQGIFVHGTDLPKLTTLSLDSNRVDSLVGLERATNLQSLKLWPDDWSGTSPGLSGTSPLAPLAKLLPSAATPVPPFKALT
jgi:hypothetical protein